MSEMERITDQLRRAFEGDAWHGPSLREVLAGVTPAQASSRPIPQAHTIWEMVLHVAAWNAFVRRRLAGERIVEVSDEQDWPPVRDTTEASWQKTLGDLERGQHELLQAVARLGEERLAEIVPGKEHSVYVMLHGLVQHALYHAGQIALLRKALG